MNPAKRRAIFERLRAANPHPASELAYRTPFELLVAVVLSAQATDKGVNKATEKLFPGRQHAGRDRRARRRRPHSVRAVDRPLPQQGEEHRRAVADPAGASTAATCPRDREALETLPGVGRKTANVVLNVAFGQPTIAVDTHIFRVANRTGLAPGQERRGSRAASFSSSCRRNSGSTRTTG